MLKNIFIKTENKLKKRLLSFVVIFLLTVSIVMNGTGQINKAHANTSTAQFGFNYWPGGYGCEVLTNANWTTANKNVIRADLDHMASLGTKVIRLMFWPQSSGWTITENGAGTFDSTFNQITSNLPLLLSYIKDRDMKIIIAFGNNYLDLKCPDGRPWWKWAYGNNGFNSFFTDSYTWVNGIATACQNSSSASSILFYDYQNESYSGVEHQWAYINQLYDNVTVIPSGKRGCSILHVPADSDNLANYLGTRTLNYVDFHSYPAHNENVSSCYTQVKNKFPNATVILGEFGCSTESSSEQTQNTKVSGFIDAAISSNIPYYLHWMFVDRAPNASNQQFGMINYNTDLHARLPKDVLGTVSTKLNSASNPDMEILTGSQPTNWSAGGTQTITSFTGINDSLNAATGSKYARLRVDNKTSGSVWISSTFFSIDGKTKVHANAYYRSNLANVKLALHFYDANNNLISSSTGITTTTSWAWNNYSQRVGGSQSWTIPSNAKKAILAIVGDISSSGGTQYLDVDTVSAFAR